MHLVQKIIVVSILFYIVSCARTKTINLKSHSFNSTPAGIIHLIIPGLSEEQFLFMDEKFVSGGKSLEVNRFSCFGSIWSHNLTEISMDMNTSVISQMTGVPVSEKKCDVYQSIPIWSKLKPFAYKSAYIEYGDSVYDEATKCNKDFFNDIAVFSSVKNSRKKETFHYQENVGVKNGERLFDRSCQTSECFSSLENNFYKIWEELKKSKNKYVMMTDYTLINLIKKNRKKDFLEYMKNLNIFIAKTFDEIVDEEQNVLFILSGANSMKPVLRGSKRRSSLNLRRFERSMVSPVWANGPQAENFCGTYSSYDIFNRFFWQSNELEIPFKEFLNL